MPGANTGPARFGADVGGGRGAQGPVRPTTRAIGNPSALQRDANLAGAASSSMPTSAAFRPWTVDFADATIGTPTYTANKMYFMRLKGITQDMDANIIYVLGGYDAVSTYTAGVALYEYKPLPTRGSYELHLITGRFFSRDPLDPEVPGSSTDMDLSPPIRLFRDRAYVVGYVASSTSVTGAGYKAYGISVGRRTRADVTEASGFPQVVSSSGVVSASVGFAGSAEPIDGGGFIY